MMPFAKLPAGTVEGLLKPEDIPTLKNILLYHVLSGKVMAADVLKLDGKMVDTALAAFSDQDFDQGWKSVPE